MAGFSIHRELTERAVRDFPGGSVTAMRCFTPDQGHLHKRLTLRQKERAFRHGWKIAALCQPEAGYALVGVDCGHFANRFDVSCRVTPDRVELIATKQIRTGYDGIHAAVSLPPAPGLIRLEIAYDPVRASATVSVDDKIMIRDYTGHSEYRDNLGAFFSVFTMDGSMASAVFAGLRFEILG